MIHVTNFLDQALGSIYGPVTMQNLREDACLTSSDQNDDASGWKRRGARAMVKGKFTICEYGIKPNVDYALFGEGPDMLAHDKDYRVLMAKADEFRAKKAELA